MTMCKKGQNPMGNRTSPSAVSASQPLAAFCMAVLCEKYSMFIHKVLPVFQPMNNGKDLATDEVNM